jgi:hypothetical protein
MAEAVIDVLEAVKVQKQHAPCIDRCLLVIEGWRTRLSNRNGWEGWSAGRGGPGDQGVPGPV